jgi:myo-inositol-1(or 4)-monophosphatase
MMGMPIDVGNFVYDLMGEAGKLLLSFRDRLVVCRRKSDGLDLQTNADLEVENFLVAAIARQFPDHGIWAEEGGWKKERSDYCWYVDALDGTKNFYRQIPEYNIAVCLLFRNRPVLGAVNIPFYDQIFTGIEGKGAFLNKRKISVNARGVLKQCFVYAYPPKGKTFDSLRRIVQKVYRLRYSPTQNMYLCYLATGSIEAYLNCSCPSKSVEDVVPGLLVACQAGAKVTELTEGKFEFGRSGQLYLASNGKVHQKILELLK